jgi:hypothetical protein
MPTSIRSLVDAWHIAERQRGRIASEADCYEMAAKLHEHVVANSLRDYIGRRGKL